MVSVSCMKSINLKRGQVQLGQDHLNKGSAKKGGRSRQVGIDYLAIGKR